MKFKPLSTNVEELRKLLEKVKDKEARLEATLAIKKNPEIEAGILAIVIAMSDVKILDKNLKAISSPKISINAQIERIQMQIDYFTERAFVAEENELTKLIEHYLNKVKILQEKIKKLKKGSAGKYEKLKNDRRQAVLRLRRVFKEWQPSLKEEKFDIEYFLPALKELMKI